MWWVSVAGLANTLSYALVYKEEESVPGSVGSVVFGLLSLVTAAGASATGTEAVSPKQVCRALTALPAVTPISIGDLAEILLVNSATLTRSLWLMHKEGLLTISERSTMRQRFVILTGRGGQALNRCLPLWQRTQRRFVNAIGEKHWKTLQRELGRLSTIAQKLESRRRST